MVRTYEASVSGLTKTSLGENNAVSWSAGDYVWYYSANGGLLRMHTVEEAGATASMPLTLNADANFLVAVCGTSSITNYTKDALSLDNVVKATQDGTFSGNHLSIARTEDVSNLSLSFKNVVSFVSFSTQRTDISYIVFKSTDETAIHGNGKLDVSFEEGLPVAQYGSSKGSSIRVNLAGPGTYYIATLPGTLAGGFTISCYDSTDKLIGTATGKNALNIKRSYIVRLGKIDVRLVDENGVNLSGYDDDDNWDTSADSDGNIDQNGYGNDYNWDSDSDSDADLDKGGYNGDDNWDSDSSSGGNLDKGDYGDDDNWDSSSGSGGIGLFLLGHVCYISLFGGFSFKGLKPWQWIAGIAGAIAASVTLALVIGVNGVMLAPMGIYALALMMLIFSGLTGVLRIGGATWWIILCGALLFTFSDSLIAVRNFGTLSPFMSGFGVMSTYLAAQSLLAIGGVRLCKKD